MDFKNERLMMYNEEVRNRAKELLNENQADLITKYMFLEQQCKKQKEVIDKAIEYINDYDVFKVFSFPLMKRWEEEQVKSSIDYEFKTSLIKRFKRYIKRGVRMNKKEILGLCEFLKLYGYENTDNISRFIFGLQQENKILKENEEHNDKVVDKVNWENQLLKKENKQLKDNWNKLKEWIKVRDNIGLEKICLEDIVYEIIELEQGSDSNE